jgi:hypothetical protein
MARQFELRLDFLIVDMRHHLARTAQVDQRAADLAVRSMLREKGEDGTEERR